MDEGYRREVKVGIADAAIVQPPQSIATIGLGSCIGILLYDTCNKYTALIHIMLPDSTNFKVVTNPYKFANLAIPLVLEQLKQMGSNKSNIIAKIVGGASMFKFLENNINSDIGQRNIIAVKEALEKENIKIIAEDVGGNKGRSMFVNSENGKVTIKVVGIGIKEI